MSRNPTPEDVAMDFWRCALEQKIKSKNFSAFFTHALNDWKVVQKNVDQTKRKLVNKRLQNFKNRKAIYKNREELLTAATLLM